MKKDYSISIILPTFRHAHELEKTIYSLEYQHEMNFDEYEIIIVNDDPKDSDTRALAIDYYRHYENIRYIEVHDAKRIGITNGNRGMNIGARAAKGPILILMIDSCRIVTPGILRKYRDQFREHGFEICVTSVPFHIGKHYSDKSFTVQDCRELMNKIKWREDPYRLFDVKAHTRISKTGVITESTFQAMSKQNYMAINGMNEIFISWGTNNLDMWRRCTRAKPEGGVQEKGVPGKWGKVGLGLKVINIETEASFHQNHSIYVPRDHGNFNIDNEMVWSEYDRLGECVIANTTRPNWGIGDTKEIDLSNKW